MSNLIDNIVGLTYEEADKIITSAGWYARVTKRDGVAFVVTRDRRLDRVNLQLENNIVVKADIG